MPTQLSKFFIDTGCVEYTHPWTDSCISGSTGLWLQSLQESFKIYSIVYIVTLLMRRKVSIEDVKRTILGILQSTAFLSWSGFTYSLLICTLRRLLGRFHFLTVSFLPSFLSSLSAILIERPSRRTLLCLYVSNIATETLFKMGVWRGYFFVIPHGEVYIFAISIAVLLYFFRTKRDKQDSIYKIIRFIVGPYEEIEYFKKEDAYSGSVSHATRTDIKGRTKHEHSTTKAQFSKHNFNIVWNVLEVYTRIITRLKAQSKHVTCPHPYSCIHYVLTGAVNLFAYGLCGQVTLKLIFQIKRILKTPKLVKSNIFRRDNLNLAIFLGGFSGLFRLTSCFLRRACHKDSHNYAIPAGIIASAAFLTYPNNTIALYFMWKALQLMWNTAAENDKVPEVKWFPIFLYCFSTAILFHAAIIEPQNLRPSYWKFLYNLSGGRIAAMCRVPLDKFGLDTSKWLEKVLKETHTTDQHVYSF